MGSPPRCGSLGGSEHSDVVLGPLPVERYLILVRKRFDPVRCEIKPNVQQMKLKHRFMPRFGLIGVKADVSETVRWRTLKDSKE